MKLLLPVISIQTVANFTTLFMPYHLIYQQTFQLPEYPL